MWRDLVCCVSLQHLVPTQALDDITSVMTLFKESELFWVLMVG
jgi:hypothetical protein